MPGTTPRFAHSAEHRRCFRARSRRGLRASEVGCAPARWRPSSFRFRFSWRIPHARSPRDFRRCSRVSEVITRLTQDPRFPRKTCCWSAISVHRRARVELTLSSSGARNPEHQPAARAASQDQRENDFPRSPFSEGQSGGCRKNCVGERSLPPPDYERKLESLTLSRAGPMTLAVVDRRHDDRNS